MTPGNQTGGGNLSDEVLALFMRCIISASAVVAATDRNFVASQAAINALRSILRPVNGGVAQNLISTLTQAARGALTGLKFEASELPLPRPCPGNTGPLFSMHKLRLGLNYLPVK
jgi:hypothetical protein